VNAYESRSLTLIVDNNPAVTLETRHWIRKRVEQGILDEKSASLVMRAINKYHRGSFGGWIFELAESLGAKPQAAMDAASFVQFVGNTIDLFDDLEDNQCDSYLDGVPQSVRINLASQMLTLSFYACTELEDKYQYTSGLTPYSARLLTLAACGQRSELVRDPWSVEIYKEMSERMVGGQFLIYFKAAAGVANQSSEPLTPLAFPLGILVQSTVDMTSNDQRLLCLPADEIRKLRLQATDEFIKNRLKAPPRCMPILDRLNCFLDNPIP
jgi:hypothetical protein